MNHSLIPEQANPLRVLTLICPNVGKDIDVMSLKKASNEVRLWPAKSNQLVSGGSEQSAQWLLEG
jgi:hypothetical protein